MDTKEKILAAAEDLFARRGFTATSVRRLTAEADVNLAALHYHFGSKDGLIEALFERRLRPLNQERLGLLDRLEAQHGEEALPLEQLVEAFLGPPLRLSSDPGGELFMRLLGRAFSEPDEHVTDILLAQFARVASRFKAAFRRSLPHLPEEEVYWRMHFMVGAMAHTMAHASRITGLLSDTPCPPEDPESLLGRLVPFLVAGLRSPCPRSVQEGVS